MRLSRVVPPKRGKAQRSCFASRTYTPVRPKTKRCFTHLCEMPPPTVGARVMYHPRTKHFLKARSRRRGHTSTRGHTCDKTFQKCFVRTCAQVGVLPPPQGAFKGAETFKNNTPKQNKIFFIVDKIAKARASAATGCTRKTVRPTKPRPRGDPCEWNLSPPRSLSGSMASRHLFCADQWA